MNQVVAFLESLYDEDIEVKRKYVRDTGWVSQVPVIEDDALRTWLSLRALGMEAEPNCLIHNSSVHEALQGIDNAEKEFVKTNILEKARPFQVALLSGQSTFSTCEAHTATGKAFEKSVNLCRSNYNALVETDMEIIKQQLRDLYDQLESQ